MEQEKQNPNQSLPEQFEESVKSGEQPASSPTMSPEQELVALRPKLEEAERERRQFKELAQRVQADFINYRKRMEQEREELGKNANARLIMNLLPIVDDMALAISQVKDVPKDASWVEGVKLIHRKLQNLLESEGVKPIEAQGKGFDPWEHEALLYQESQDLAEGTVIAVLREGFKLHGRVLRPAQVIVAKKPQPKPDESPGESAAEESSNF